MRKTAILVYFLFALGSPVFAQSQDGAAPMDESAWARSFDDVKAQIKGLVATNDRLNAEYKSLQEEIPRMKQALDTQGEKNQDLRRFLNERHGKTDQQVRIEQLTAQLKTQKPQLAKLQIELDDLKRMASKLRKTVEAKKTKAADWDLHQDKGQDKRPLVSQFRRSGDPELDSLRRDLEQQKEQEAQLETQIGAHTDSQVDRKQIAELEAKLAALKEQKADLEKTRAVVTTDMPDQSGRAARHRAELEAKIADYEKKINAFKGSVTTGLLWGAQKKALIREIVQTDAKNQQMRSKIGDLKEDVGVLREQIASLQNKLNFSQGKGKKRF